MAKSFRSSSKKSAPSKKASVDRFAKFKKDTPKKSFAKREDSPASDRPKRKFTSDDPDSRPKRSYSRDDQDAKPKRRYSTDEQSARPKRSFSKSDPDARPKRSYSRDDQDAKPKRRYSADEQSARPKRSFSKSDPDARPKRSYSRDDQDAKPKRRYSADEQSARPKRSFSKSDPDAQPKRSYSRDDQETRPKRRFNPDDRSERSDEEKKFRPRPDAYDRPSRSSKSFDKPADKKGKPAPKPADESEGMRLNKYLAHSGIASRRAADMLILQGFVTVNGEVVKEMGHKVKPTDVIEYKGATLKPEEKLIYILLNKPRNVISTASDERGRKTVLDIIAEKFPQRVYPVGRLDRNTSGLILLTNDGELTKKLSHPSHKVPKIYHATLDKNLSLKDLEAIREGIILEDGEIKADSLHFAEEGSKRDVHIELHSGKNRIVRRIFEHLGYEVTKLDRLYYAGLTKKNLPRGFFRPLTKEEVRMLKHFT